MAVTIRNVLSDVFCDRLSVTVPIPEDERAVLTETISNLVTLGYVEKLHNKAIYRRSYSYPLGGAQTSKLHIKCDPYNPTYNFLRFEFNPSGGHLGELQEAIHHIIPGGYDHFLANGKCTRIDAAVDVRISMNRILAWKAKVQKTSSYSLGASIQTYYLGSKTSAKQICIYDKVAEIKGANAALLCGKKQVPSFPLTRIEARYYEEWPLNQLYSLPNQFAGMSLVAAPAGELDGYFEMFVLACRAEGPQLALALIKSPKVKKDFKARLKKGRPHWWNPESTWDGWAAATQLVLQKQIPPYSLSPLLNVPAKGQFDVNVTA